MSMRLSSEPGSPPRMRGKPCREARRLSAGRITPAHAGKTRSQLSTPRRCADHPRACGENNGTWGEMWVNDGSPPRMRGKPFDLVRIHRYGQDHPRACGENSEKWHKCSRGGGSPPRMRGKRTWSRRDSGFRRITPAHAGKTIRRTAQSYTCADHPRACGENRTHRRYIMTRYGSPPRMRGKHKCF